MLDVPIDGGLRDQQAPADLGVHQLFGEPVRARSPDPQALGQLGHRQQACSRLRPHVQPPALCVVSTS